VDVVLRYDTPSRQEEADEDTPRPERVLQVFKNRLTGKVKTDGIGLYYQESSKRISEDKMTFDWELGWEDECFSSFKNIDQLEIPFDA
jgi:hypothetical protein